MFFKWKFICGLGQPIIAFSQLDKWHRQNEFFMWVLNIFGFNLVGHNKHPMHLGCKTLYYTCALILDFSIRLTISIWKNQRKNKRW